MRRTCAHLLVPCSLLLSSGALATVVRGWSVEEMGRRSERVVHARVVEARTTWTAGRTQIVTYTTFAVVEAIKGKGDGFTLRQVGGAIDGMESRIPGDARFAPGEEVILFLEKGPEPETLVLIAMAAAKVSIVDGAAGKRAERNLEGVAFAVSGPGQPFRVQSPPPTEDLGPLYAFKATLRRALAR